ncbi:MAG: hypothetical protein L0Z50_06830, partial [Verrucomicrobiales bacterium]|nr:hypothetical protein [Verrucomicrobiales bacterium]
MRADIHLKNGATLMLPVATNIDGSRFTVTSGSKFVLPPLITAYNGDFNALSLGGHVGFTAIGPGSLIDLRGLSRLQGNNALFQDCDVVARDGAVIDISDLRTISSGQIQITAESSGISSASKIDLSALEEYSSAGPVTRTIYLNIGGNGVVALPKLRLFQNAYVHLYSGGHIDLPSLTNIDGTSIKASGTTFVLPERITTYADTGASLGGTGARFEANGNEGKLDLTSLREIKGSGHFTRTMLVSADGGTVLAGNIETLSSGYLGVEASQPNSFVDVSKLRNIWDDSATFSFLKIANLTTRQLNGGIISIPLALRISVCA